LPKKFDPREARVVEVASRGLAAFFLRLTP
jgi:hypothetical protein